MNYDEMIIFENQLNDDVPPNINSFVESQKIHSPFQHYNIDHDEFINKCIDSDIPVEVLRAQHEEFKNEQLNPITNNFSSDGHMDNPYYDPHYNPDYNPDYNSDHIHHNKEMYYDSFLNEYVPINKTERLNSNIKDMEKVKEDDFKLTEALFNSDNTDNTDNTDIISQLIDIYRECNNKTCEFTEMQFPYQKVPIKIIELNFVTELIISKTNIEKIEFLPPNLEKLTLTKSELLYVDCKDFPNSLTHINFSNNKLQIITNIGDNIKTLILDSNMLSEIVLPQSMDKVSLKDNKFNDVNFIKNMIYLRELDISDNNVSDVDDIIDSVEILSLSKNCILEINKLPSSLKEIISYNNKTYKICEQFPKNLTKIDFYNNNFEKFPDLTESVKWVDLSFNDLKKLPKNFAHLEYFDISSNDNIGFDPSQEEWKLFLECSSKNKQFQFDQHESYIITSDSPNVDFSDSDNEDITKYEISKRIIKPPSYEDSQYTQINSTTNDNVDEVDEFIWSYNIKSEMSDIPVFKKRYVNLKKTYVI